MFNQISESIFTINDFLSLEECSELIEFSEKMGYSEAEVGLPSGAKMMKGIRDNYRLLYKDEQWAEKYWQRLKDFVPQIIDNQIVIGLNEQFRFYRYELNQRFKKHIDGRFKRGESEESRLTFMVYLNEDFEGGETEFENVKIKPQIGMALIFVHELKHTGCPVLSGKKYVLRSDVIYTKY